MVPLPALSKPPLVQALSGRSWSRISPASSNMQSKSARAAPAALHWSLQHHKQRHQSLAEWQQKREERRCLSLTGSQGCRQRCSRVPYTRGAPPFVDRPSLAWRIGWAYRMQRACRVISHQMLCSTTFSPQHPLNPYTHKAGDKQRSKQASPRKATQRPTLMNAGTAPALTTAKVCSLVPLATLVSAHAASNRISSSNGRPISSCATAPAYTA